MSSSANMKGSPYTPPVRLETAKEALASRLIQRGKNGKLRLLMLGDSMTGFNTYGYGRALMDRIFAVRGDVASIGTLVGTLGAPYPPYDLYHEGHSGYTIEQLTAGYAGWVATAGTPDIVVVMAGTNNYASDTGATCATKTAALLAAIAAATPQALVIVSSNKPSPTASPNDVNRAAHTALLPGVVAAAGSSFFFVDAGSLLYAKVDGVPSDSPAWTHPNDNGRMVLSASIFEVLEQSILPPREGRKFPFDTEQATIEQACLSLVGNTDAIYAGTSMTECQPGSGSFAYMFQVYFNNLSSSAAAILSYGNTYAYDLLLTQAGSGASLYLKNSGTPVAMSSGSTMPGIWKARTWHDVIIHYDQPNDIVSIWRDGVLVGSASGLTPTFHASDLLVLGKNSPVISGVSMDGLVRRLAVCKGSSVPSFSQMRVYAEAWHCAQRVLPGISAYFLLADAPSTWTSAIGGTSITSKVGSPAQSAARAVPTPWDPPIGQANKEHGMAFGYFTLNGTTPVTVTLTSGTFPKTASILLALKSSGSTPGTGAPYLTSSGTADAFTAVSSTLLCNDIIMWIAIW